MTIVLLVLGILSLGYYALIATYAGPMVSFGFFWIGLAVIFIASGLIRYEWLRHDKVLPKWLKFGALLVLLIGIIAFGILEGALIYTGNQSPVKEANYMIVLGAKVNGTRPSAALNKRLEAALSYASNNPSTQVIVSGGKGPGENISEAQAMADYLTTHGIDQSRIILEDKSTNTNENIQYSKKLMTDSSLTTVLVTNDFHVFRGIQICKENGISQISGLGAGTPWRLVINSYIREAFAVAKDYMAGHL